MKGFAFSIRDRAGVVPVAEMRRCFEGSVRGTPKMGKALSLEAVAKANGGFSHYTHEETEALWLGFALGMRCAQRLTVVKVGAAVSEYIWTEIPLPPAP